MELVLEEYASGNICVSCRTLGSTSRNQEYSPILDMSSCITLTKPLVSSCVTFDQTTEVLFSFCKTMRERMLAQNSSLDLGNKFNNISTIQCYFRSTIPHP